MSVTGWKMFAWVADGTYDNLSSGIRHVLVDGMPTITITKMWLDSGGPADVPEELRRAWGAFPDIPPKPEK